MSELHTRHLPAFPCTKAWCGYPGAMHSGCGSLPPYAEGTQAKAGVGVGSGDNIPFILPLEATRHNPTFSVMDAPLERQRFLKPIYC